jgi:hypothetical protein
MHQKTSRSNEDDGRQADHVESITQESPAEFAGGWVSYLQEAHEQYKPLSFWDHLEVYIEMTVEKVE